MYTTVNYLFDMTLYLNTRPALVHRLNTHTRTQKAAAPNTHNFTKHMDAIKSLYDILILLTTSTQVCREGSTGSKVLVNHCQ